MNDPQPQSPAMPDLGASSFEADLFWEKNKTAIIAGLSAVIVLAIASASWFAFDASSQADARNMLALAGTTESLEKIVSAYPGSLPTADALLLLAADHRAAGNMEASTASFRKFLDQFPEHPLAGGALLGIAQNQEASGDQSAASTSYQQVLTGYPASYATPFAAYADAEILLRNLQREEASKRYTSIVSQFPNSPAAGMAIQQLRRLGANASAIP